MLYILDAQFSIAQGHKTLLDHGLSKVPRASPDALFIADSAESWSSLYHQGRVHEESSLTAYAHLESIRAAICEARVNHTLTMQRITRLEDRLRGLCAESIEHDAHSSSDDLALGPI